MRKLVLLAAVMVAALGLVACGGEEGDGGGAATPAISQARIDALLSDAPLSDWNELSADDKAAVIVAYLEQNGVNTDDPDSNASLVQSVDAFASAPGAGEVTLRETLDSNGQAVVDGTGFDAAGCRAELGDLLAALEEVDSRLALGLPYAEYRDRVGDARVAYDRIDFGSLDLECTSKVGVFVEQGLNRYQRAATRWGDCIEDFDCDVDAIEPSLQAQWSRAEQLIDRARTALG